MRDLGGWNPSVSLELLGTEGDRRRTCTDADYRLKPASRESKHDESRSSLLLGITHSNDYASGSFTEWRCQFASLFVNGGKGMAK